MPNDFDKDNADNLHPEIKALIESGKMNPKTIPYLSGLDIDAEQLWVLRFYHQYGVLPTIKQSKQLQQLYVAKKLTLKTFQNIMETKLKPQKVTFSYNDFSPFFEEGITSDEIKVKVIKILSNWQNNRMIT